MYLYESCRGPYVMWGNLHSIVMLMILIMYTDKRRYLTQEIFVLDTE